MRDMTPQIERVLLAGGGTAGHVHPLLATADALRARNPQVEIVVLGSEGGLEEDLVPARGHDLRLIPKVAFPRRPNADALRFPGKFRKAVSFTKDLLDEVDAQVVIGFGGHVSTPAYLAGRKRGTPVVIHEQNARPGLANRLGARFSEHVAVTFSVTKLPGAQVIGMPLRREIVELDRAGMRVQARQEFGLDADRPTLLVTGGSLGAVSVNTAVREAATDLLDAGVQVLHVTGRGKTFDAPTGKAPYVVLEYADRMDLCYAAADAVVTRSGAGMVCETSAVGLPAVFVPLPIGNGEQSLNAADAVAAGGAVLVDDDEFDASWIRSDLVPMVTSADRLAAMSAAQLGQQHAGAADALVDLAQGAISR